MNAGRRDNAPGFDRDLIGKLFSAGFTILGIGLPVMAGAVAALRESGVSSVRAEGLRLLLWLLLPAIPICAVQTALCLGTLGGLFVLPRAALALTFVLLVYMMTSMLAWTLLSLLA